MKTFETKRGFVAGIVAVGLALGSALAIAKEHGHRGHHGWGGKDGMGHMHHVLKQLDLSPEQRETINGILSAAKPELSALHEEMRNVRDSLMDTNPDDANYATVVNAASQKSGELASQLVLELSEIRTQIHSVLTEEQKAQLPEIRAQMKERMEERHESRRERIEAYKEKSADKSAAEAQE